MKKPVDDFKLLYKINMRGNSKEKYYDHVLNLIKIPKKEIKVITKLKYSFFKIFDVLKKNNKLIYIFVFLLYPHFKFKSLPEENITRKVFEEYLDYCMVNIPQEIYDKVDMNYFKYFFKKNFYLSYTNLNNLELLTKLNKFYKKFRKVFFNIEKVNKKKLFLKRNKIKIGIVCNQIFNPNKPVSRDRTNVLLNLDKSLFDIYLITNLNPTEASKLSYFNNYNKIFCSYQNAITTIINNFFDILFYPEIGMDIFTFWLGFHKLAPIQCVTWGHSETTAMESMDYYITSKYYNTLDDQKYFSEKIVLLESLGTYYTPTKKVNENINKSKVLKKFQIDPNKNIYNSIQTPGKICRYEFLNLVKQILSKDPNGIFLTIYYTIIEKNFVENYLSEFKKQVKLLKFQKKPYYQELLEISTILLDPYPFGSLNTSLDSFMFNKVILCMPSNKINGNFCSGFYKKMNILEPIAYSEEEYINKALKLTSDHNYRKSIENEIYQKRNLLFNEQNSIKEYNMLFKNIYEKTSGNKLDISSNKLNVKYDNMMIINKKNKIYRQCITKNKNMVYIDNYGIVWRLDNNDYLISDGMIFGNTIFNNECIREVLINMAYVKLTYPNVIPIIENNYEKKDIDINPKGNEVITWMIAVYNRKDLVKDTIDSLLNQTDPNWKCVICDDGSTDGSYQYIKSYVENDDRFDIYTKKNSGYVQTCRFMYEKVNTDVVAIIDSDDVLEPKANEILVNRYRKEKCNAIYTAYMLCDSDLNVIRTVIPQIKNDDLLIKNPFEHIRSWRKNCLPTGAFPKFIVSAEDQDLAYRFEEQGIKNILIEKTALVKFRQSKNSLMRNKKTYEEARKCHYLAKIAALNRRNK